MDIPNCGANILPFRELKRRKVIASPTHACDEDIHELCMKN